MLLHSLDIIHARAAELKSGRLGRWKRVRDFIRDLMMGSRGGCPRGVEPRIAIDAIPIRMSSA
jgi:hypothetical protein